MKKLIVVAATIALTTASTLWAAEVGGASQTSATEGKSLFAESLKDEVLGISPVIGTVAYGDPTGIYRSRSAVGLLSAFRISRSNGGDSDGLMRDGGSGS